MVIDDLRPSECVLMACMPQGQQPGAEARNAEFGSRWSPGNRN